LNEPYSRYVEIQIRVVADQKEGLLFELGKTVLMCGFTLVRQRLTESNEGISLNFAVRGPEAGALELEDRLATQRRVRSYESMMHEVAAPAPPKVSGSQPRTPAQGLPSYPPPSAGNQATHAQAPGRRLNGRAVELGGRTTAPAPQSSYDRSRLEILLPKLAADYPQILPRLVLLEQEVPAEEHESVLRYVGNRVGAWVYKRDFSLGARLGLHDAVRHIALPATRQLLPAEIDDDGLRIKASPFCGNDQHGRTCHFFRGFFEGLINTSRTDKPANVEEAHCRNTGASYCVFTFSD
jgi:predicted hydrocarbon binding protein